MTCEKCGKSKVKMELTQGAKPVYVPGDGLTGFLFDPPVMRIHREACECELANPPKEK